MSKNSKIFNTDIEYMVHSYNTFNKFTHKIKAISENTNLFWKELGLQRPNFNRLENLGFWIAEETENLKHYFNDMEVTRGYRTQCTLLYIGYLNRVLNKDERNSEIKQLRSKIGIDFTGQSMMTMSLGTNTMKHINMELIEESQQNDYMKINALGVDYVEESHKLNKKGIIVCSGEQKSIGKVININDRVFQLFGYKNRDVINQNVSIMMPHFIGGKHDKWMQAYFKRGGDHSIFDSGARTIFVRKTSGYLMECTLDVKVVPDLVFGIRLVGVIYENKIGPDVEIHKSDERSDIEVGKLQKPGSMKLLFRDSNKILESKFNANNSTNPFRTSKVMDSDDISIGMEMEKTEQVTYQILFLRSTSRIMGVSETCFKHLGLKSSFFNGNVFLSEESRVGLDDISPKLAKDLKDISKVNQYLDLKEVRQFRVQICTEYLEEKFLAVRNEEDDLNQVKKIYDQ